MFSEHLLLVSNSYKRYFSRLKSVKKDYEDLSDLQIMELHTYIFVYNVPLPKCALIFMVKHNNDGYYNLTIYYKYFTVAF